MADRIEPTMHAVAGPPVGREFAGWRLLKLIGQGANGSVYLAEGPGHPGQVALKLVALDATGGVEAAHRAFLASASVSRGLQHPGIVRLLDAGAIGTTGWAAMEAVPGCDLTRYTSPSRLLPEPVVVRLGARVARALSHAHRQGVVHRDLKPANVMVDWPSDTVKLTDFGLARTVDAAQTGTGVVLGSPAYMAPEQLAGNLPTAQTDLYALGAMLFQLLSGRLPHEAATMGELLRQVASEPAPDVRTLVPRVQPALAELLARLLARRSIERPADAAEVAEKLAAIAAGRIGAR